MEISLTAPIASGRTADVFAWQDGTVLKLYQDWCPPHWIEQEARTARAIKEAGIPSPEVGKIINVNNRRGLIYERVSGVSMLQDMNLHPWTIFKHARNLAELHVKIHRLSVHGLDSYREELKYAVQQAPLPGDELRKGLLSRLAKLPDGDKVCHGDFHPNNVLLTNHGAVIIDWMGASTGNPWADVARTSTILSVGANKAGKQVSSMIRIVIRLYHRVYLRRYVSLNPDQGEELAKWLPVVAAARLNERIEGEQQALLEMAQNGLAQ